MSAESVDTPESVENFIKRWESAEASERSNYGMFVTELCDLLELPHPDPSTADNNKNSYVIDRAIQRNNPDGTFTTVYADLYKRGCFMLETKQGANAKKDNPDQLALLDEGSRLKTGHGVRGTRKWDIALEKAYNQARGYIRYLPSEEGRPPFLMVCDVGFVIELYSEFTCTGGTYVRFPDPQNHRIYLEDLRKSEIRERLYRIWADPHTLDPGKHAARVTREVAWHLAELAKSLDRDGHDAQQIATFLQRSLFTLFAEDVGLLPDNSFIGLLKQLKDHPEGFPITIGNLWKDMATEQEWSSVLMKNIAYFNGGLFENATALPLNSQQIALLIGAAKPDWSDVEPAIFGTLLERALHPQERHKLGAHYTPRSYVERLVKPTIIDPLRNRWDVVKTAAAQFVEEDKTKEAISVVKDFHHELCKVRVLDPACGSGNFLYVTLEHMKRLEGEVLELLESLGDQELTFEMEQFKVRPQQFYGLEINERAVAIAQLVLWIGYFQWHKKTTGTADTKDRPLLPKQQTIIRQDAVLAYDAFVPRKDAFVPRKVEAASSRLSSIDPKRQDAASTIESVSSHFSYQYFNPHQSVDITHANLPHWKQHGATYFVTFRLADSIPQEKLKVWQAEREDWKHTHPLPLSPEHQHEYFERFPARLEAWLDAGQGSCLLKEQSCAEIVQATLRYFDAKRYDLGEFVVAANHVHVLVTPREGFDLSDILHSWKSYSANQINQLVGRDGPVWQKESYDHIVRSPEAVAGIERYIREHDRRGKRQDAASTFVTIWDGRTTKTHPVTGKEVPDDSARIPVYDYVNPRRPEWPEADYIVGNPPFIGTSRMRGALGDGYTEALRKVWKKDVPESADFVMFWWEKAAELLRAGKIQRFGLITTNSIHQTFNRRVLEKHLNVEAGSSRSAKPKDKRQDAASTNPMQIAFAIPDHPWVDTVDGAAVRIAMTVGTCESGPGQLDLVTQESELEDGEKAVELKSSFGKIVSNLKIGADLVSARQLTSNLRLSNRGFCLFGQGFIVSPDEAEKISSNSNPNVPSIIFDYRNGKDITATPRGVNVIDAFGYEESELRNRHPGIYQHLLLNVKPERDKNKREIRRRLWWLFGEPNKLLRDQLSDLERYISTVETSKHRFFVFLDKSILPDNMLVNIACEDAAVLGVLSSVIHVNWAIRQGGTLEDRPRYNKTRCFETFPFPDINDENPIKARIRDLGEQLDSHRKRQQSAHSDLTLTGMYNVLEKLRVEAASSRLSPKQKRQDGASTFTQKDRRIHDEGLVSVLKQIHDELDSAVLEAYGWQDLDTGKPLADRLAANDEAAEALEQELLTRLVALNHERAEEEKHGLIRWLRPEYQNPEGTQAGSTSDLPDLDVKATPATKAAKLKWPTTLPDQVAAIRHLLPETGIDPAAIASHFGKRSKKRLSEIDQILTTLKNLGQL